MISFFRKLQDLIFKPHPIKEHSDKNGFIQTVEQNSFGESSAMSAEKEVHIPVPPISKPFYGLKNRIAYFGFSQRGQSHIDSGKPCQDRCFHAYIPESGILVVAIADGVGSCALSDLGADTAVHAAVEFVYKALRKQTTQGQQIDRTLVSSILRNAMQHAYDEVERKAQEYEQLLYSLQSTLTISIYDGTDLYFGHAGDDGIVVLTEERTLALATSRHKGEEVSSVYPLQNCGTWQFGMVPGVAAFVMATDGVLDAFVRSSFENERVYYPFLEPLFTAEYNDEEAVKRVGADLYAYMKGEEYRAVVTDDITVAVVMNNEKLPHCLPQFDSDAWKEDTRQYEEKVRNALYGHTLSDSKSLESDQNISDPPFSQGETNRNIPQEALRGHRTSRKNVPISPVPYRNVPQKNEKQCRSQNRNDAYTEKAPPIDNARRARKNRVLPMIITAVCALILILLLYTVMKILSFLLSLFCLIKIF